VPGYINAKEIDKIASFIAGINPDIPYALLGFHSDFLMTDLPRTSWDQANRCLKAAKDTGLKNVRIGNTHILS
jgi:pyruvate formate lyase activating enzyme